MAVIGETLTRGKVMVRMERTGRPEVKNLLLAPKPFDPVNRDLEIRDLYNSEDAFCLGETYQGAYRARLNANLRFWDGLDGKADWPDLENGSPSLDGTGAGRLPGCGSNPTLRRTRLLFGDRTCRPRGPLTSDLRRQKSQRRRDGHPVYAVGERGQRSPIRDGVDQASVPATAVFPYLAALNPDPPQAPCCT